MFLIVFTALCVGMVTGAFSALNMGPEPETTLNQMADKDIIISSFAENLKFLGWLVLWGVNLLGFPVIIYLLYAKGASVSAAICALAFQNNSSGILLVLSALPYIACTIASVMLLSQGSLSCSFGMLKGLLGRRTGKGISENLLVMIAEFIPSMLLTLLGGVCETIIKVNIV